MHVLMILDKEFPSDVRVQREAVALMDAGSTVSLVCRNRDGRPVRDEVSGIEVLRLPRFRGLPAKLRGLLQKPFFFNPVYAIAISRALRERRCDAVHMHDLPLVALGLWFARRRSIPLVFDLHEDFPAMIRTENRSGIQHLLYNRWDLLGKLERYCLNRSDRMLVVTEESRQRLIGLGVDPGHVAVVGNCVDLESFLAGYPADHERTPGKLRMLYTGILGGNRGLPQVLDAMAILKEDGIEVEFHLVGEGPERAGLEALAARHGLADLLVIHGWVPQTELASYIADCDFCVIPHEPNEHVDTTMPNKIFEFMAAKKACIVSSARPLANLVREWECGLAFPYGDAKTLAERIGSLATDAELRERLGANGLRAVEERHQWALEQRSLLGIYDGLASPESTR